jgi:glycosyltransferase involved in cell wall biosynthesis
MVDAAAGVLRGARPAPTGRAPGVRPGDLQAIRDVRQALRDGDLDGALAEARARVAGSADPSRLEALVASIEGTLRATTPGWLPGEASGSHLQVGPLDATSALERDASAVAGRVMMLVSDSILDRSGGFGLRTHAVARAQRSAGMDTHVVTPPLDRDGPAPRPGERIVDGVPYHLLEPGPPESPLDRTLEALLRRAAEVEQRLQPALIHTAESATMRRPTAQVGLALARARGVPMVFEVRGFREDSWLARGSADREASQLYRMTRDCDTWLMRAADAVVTLSGVMRQELVARGLPEDHITVVPNAADTELFSPRPPDEALTERLGVHEGQVIIGYVGGLQPYEALPTLVDAVGALVERGRDVRALIVGDGSMREAISARIAERDLDSRVTVIGTVPHAEIQRWYSVMDIVVNARTGDRVSRLVSPTKPLEALAMERALIVSRIPAMLEGIVEGETALAVDPGSLEQLVDAMDTLVCDPDLRQRMGAAGRRWVATERSWAANGRVYRRLFERLGAI